MSDIKKAVERFDREIGDLDTGIAEEDRIIAEAKKRREQKVVDRALAQDRKDMSIAVDQCANMISKGGDISPVKIPVDALGFNSEIVKSLRAKGVKTAADLVELYPDQLTKLLGGSARTFQKITSILDVWGWRLSDE